MVCRLLDGARRSTVPDTAFSSLRLGYHAFHRVLSTKAPIYKSILDALREELAKPKMRVAAVRMAGIVENREHDFVQNALKKRTGKV